MATALSSEAAKLLTTYLVCISVSSSLIYHQKFYSRKISSLYWAWSLPCSTPGILLVSGGATYLPKVCHLQSDEARIWAQAVSGDHVFSPTAILPVAYPQASFRSSSVILTFLCLSYPTPTWSYTLVHYDSKAVPNLHYLCFHYFMLHNFSPGFKSSYLFIYTSI